METPTICCSRFGRRCGLARLRTVPRIHAEPLFGSHVMQRSRRSGSGQRPETSQREACCLQIASLLQVRRPTVIAYACACVPVRSCVYSVYSLSQGVAAVVRDASTASFIFVHLFTGVFPSTVYCAAGDGSTWPTRQHEADTTARARTANQLNRGAPVRCLLPLGCLCVSVLACVSVSACVIASIRARIQ